MVLSIRTRSSSRVFFSFILFFAHICFEVVSVAEVHKNKNVSAPYGSWLIA